MSGKYKTFGDFWYYNKLKIFAVVAVLALTILGIKQCSLGDTIDLGIVHISREQNTSGDKLLESLRENANLKKSGDELALEFTHIYMPDDFEDAAQIGAMEKTQIEITTGKSTLYILDSETVYSYRNSDIFHDLGAIADKYGISDEKRYKDDTGKVIAISVEGNKHLENSSLLCDDSYIAMRCYSESKAHEHKNSLKAVEYIIANG